MKLSLSLSRDQSTKFQRHPWSLFEIGALCLVSITHLSVLLLVLREFSPLLTVGLSVTTVVVMGTVFGLRLPAWNRRMTTCVGLVLLAAVLLRWEPFAYVLGGQDEGIYYNMSSYFEREGNLSPTDTVRSLVGSKVKGILDQHEHRLVSVSDVDGRLTGSHLPGVYIQDLDRSELVFQFYPAFPALLAIGGALFGPENRGWMLTLISIAGVFTSIVLVWEITGRTQWWVGALAGCLMAANPLMAFLGRFPVTESLSWLLSSLGLLFLLRWLRTSKSLNQRSFWLSLLSLCGLFLNHISGFLWIAFLQIFLFVVCLTQETGRHARAVVIFGLASAFVWWLSYVYGIVFSFPYSRDIYRASLGADLGDLLVRQPVVFSAVLIALMLSAWLLVLVLRRPLSKGRKWYRCLASGRSFWLVFGLLAGVLALWGVFKAYQLGYTDTYSGDSFADLNYHLSHTGKFGALHGSFITFLLYFGVPQAVLLFSVPFLLRSRPNAGQLLLAGTVLLFLCIRVIVNDITYYYYYARYLGSELVPYSIVFLAVLVHEALPKVPSRLAKGLLASLVVSGICLNLTVTALQKAGGELLGTEQSFASLVKGLEPHSLVVFEGKSDGDMVYRTTLSYYFDVDSTVLTEDELQSNLEVLQAHWDAVYWISRGSTPKEATPVGKFPIPLTHYDREHNEVVPMGGTTTIDTLDLFVFR